MKTLKIVLLSFLLLLVVLLAAFWTPDAPFEDMRAKYGSGNSRFLYLGSQSQGGDMSERIHFRDQGLRSGRTLVLVHGTSASLHTWEPLIEELKQEFRLVSIDLPGHGLTGARNNRDYSIKAMVDSIWQLLDHLQIERASIAGNSLGGRVAWEAALDKPARVAGLILLAPSGAPRVSESKSNIGFKILGTSWGQALMTKITPRFIIEKSLEQTVVNRKIINKSMVTRYWELITLKGNRKALIDLANTARDSEAWTRLSGIKSPTLVIWGEEDNLLPAHMSVIFNGRIADSELVRLKNIGHIPMEEATKAVSTQILRFCSKQKC